MSHSRTPIVLALLALALVGCSSSTGRATHASPTPTPACRAPGKPILPHTDGTLTEDDDGARICLAKGQVIAVFLNAHSKDAHKAWQPVTAQPASAVRRLSNGVMSLPIGVTAALFSPAVVGDVQLASRRADGGTWHAALVVH
ncbi:hypothetical protein QZH56_14155 [Streptomyces olivoreticuli]|uniref:hypothetical protein n=1 Tax=Streptomyces olivoreticuli TaxID=68246 RepID=UPI0026594E22|nr:hypothetical protein [Streptomyces olivoreticuli]WKK26630.1 hypothetical protein QZH56_14155 [Streptomyces olivoreticuli]